MKKKLVVSIAACMLLIPGLAVANGNTFSGKIMDSPCAKNGSHEMMSKKQGATDSKSCTLNCVKMGYKYVLFNGASNTVYQLDDQTKPETFAGRNVKVTGTLDPATKTIHVKTITAASKG
jgi:hypothetical protein